MNWSLLAVKAALHSEADGKLRQAERLLESHLSDAVERVRAAFAGDVVIDLDGTVQTEADVRERLGLPPARTPVERLREKLTAHHYPVLLHLPAAYCGHDPDAPAWQDRHPEDEHGEPRCLDNPDGQVCASCWTDTGVRASWPCVTAQTAGLHHHPTRRLNAA